MKAMSREWRDSFTPDQQYAFYCAATGDTAHESIQRAGAIFQRTLPTNGKQASVTSSLISHVIDLWNKRKSDAE